MFQHLCNIREQSLLAHVAYKGLDLTRYEDFQKNV